MNSFLSFLFMIVMLAAGMLTSFMVVSSFSQYRRTPAGGKMAQGIIWTAVLAALLIFTALRGGILAAAIGALIGAMPFLQISNKETDTQVAANKRDAEKRKKEFERRRTEREEKRNKK